jgi:hypothetical protein
MHFSQARRFVLWLLAFCIPAFCLSANTNLVNPDSAFFISLTYNYTKRDGFYDFPELRKSQPVHRNTLNMLGGAAGKRWSVNKYVRFQVTIGYEAGSAIEDTLLLETPSLVKYSFYHAAIDPALQFPLSQTERVKPFLVLGGGLDYVYAKKSTEAIDKSHEWYYENLPWMYVRSGRFSGHTAVGFGLDYAVSRGALVSLGYSFRYSQPVRYGLQEDFPLQEQNYRETFFSNLFQLALLFDFR